MQIQNPRHCEGVLVLCPKQAPHKITRLLRKVLAMTALLLFCMHALRKYLKNRDTANHSLAVSLQNDDLKIAFQALSKLLTAQLMKGAN
jgi:hypothetical protein